MTKPSDWLGEDAPCWVCAVVDGGAEAYRAAGSRAIALAMIVSRSRGTVGASFFSRAGCSCSTRSISACWSAAWYAGRNATSSYSVSPRLYTSEAGPVGPDHFCLSIQCDDLKAVAEALRGKAVALEGDVVQRFGAWGDGPSIYLRDPDGHMIELKPRS